MKKKINYIIFKLKKNFFHFFWVGVSKYYSKYNSDSVNSLITKNREFLNKLGTLLPLDEYKNNDYGIPYKNLKYINKPIGNFLCNFDFIIILINSLTLSKVRYLEIGVSVMKNFMLVNNYFDNNKLVAFDINPIVKKHKNKFIKNNKFSNNLFFSNNEKNKLVYYQGDVLNSTHTSDFNNYLDFNFNFIYSDALHTQEGVESEFNNLIKGNLEDKFIIYYDDLDIKWDEFNVEAAVKNIYLDLKNNDPEVKLYTFWIYGWLGKFENMHKNAIITNYDLEEILKNIKIRLPFFNKIN